MLYRYLQWLVSWTILDPVKLTVRTYITPSRCRALSCVPRTLRNRKNKLQGEICSLLCVTLASTVSAEASHKDDVRPVQSRSCLAHGPMQTIAHARFSSFLSLEGEMSLPVRSHSAVTSSILPFFSFSLSLYYQPCHPSSTLNFFNSSVT